MSSHSNTRFYQYSHGTVGRILEELRYLGLSHIADDVIIEGNSRLTLNGKLFANYKYFEGIEQPLFNFQNAAYGRNRMHIEDNVWDTENKFSMDCHLVLGPHGNPALIFNKVLTTPEFHDFISSILGDRTINSACYKLCQDAGAFFQGGSDNREGGFIYIEFWKPKSAQAFVDYVNKNYSTLNCP